MLRFLAKNWWALELSGAVMIISGVFALFLPLLGLVAPAIAFEVLVKLFGIYILAEGFILLAVSFKSESTQDKWIALIQGIAGIGTGIAAFALPGMTAFALLLIIAAWATMRGILEIVGAIRLWKEIGAEWLMILSGIFSLVFAGVLLSNREAGALAFGWVIGLFAIIIGFLLMGLGIKVRKVNHPPT